MSSIDHRTANAASRFSAGLRLPFEGVRRMLSAPLLPWVAIPMLITAVMLIAAWWSIAHYGTDLTVRLVGRPAGEGWQLGRTALFWTGWVLVHGVLLVVGSILAWTTGTIVASPFYDQLSAKVEQLELHPSEEAFDLRLVLVDIGLGILHTLYALALYLALACPLTLLNLLPGVGTAINLALGMVISALFLGREVTDFSLSRRRLTFMGKLGLIRQHLPTYLGLGAGSLLLMSIPLANFLAMPAAVIGGTLLCCHLQQQGLLDDLPTAVKQG